MGIAKFALYAIGLVLVVAAVWLLLTETVIAEIVPAGVAIALILLIAGIGIMASANTFRETRATRRVVHESAGPPGYVVDRDLDGETVVEERRYE